MSEAVDIAVNKPAKQSSICQWSRPHSVDGDARGANSGTVPEDFGFHTDNESNPWWQVDLEDEFFIDKIIILNRRNCAARFCNFTLLKSFDGESWQPIYQKTDNLAVGGPQFLPFVLTFQPDEHLARFIRIRLDGTAYFHLRTVQVFGRKPVAAEADAGSAPEPVAAETAAPEPVVPEPVVPGTVAAEAVAAEPVVPEPAAVPTPDSPPPQPRRKTSFWSFMGG